MDQFVAQLERQPDDRLVAVLYVNGGRADTRPVGSVRQGKRRAHDLLCAAVDAQVKQAAALTGLGGPPTSTWCPGHVPASPA